MSTHRTLSIAIIGAGIAGASCAQVLARAGHAVHVFDKARGPGGRLATRFMSWVDLQGQAHTARLDHGAVGISARSPAFQSFLAQAVRAGAVADWAPTLAADSWPQGDALKLPVPDMPELCRRLLQGLPASWSTAADCLHRSPLGWQVEAGGERRGAPFDAVLLAVPPAQAAPLLSPHRSDWARHASVSPMQPCWTLMGVAAAPTPDLAWDLCRPPSGSLAWVLRSDARPGRERVPGQAHWVVHARSGWSRKHLEQPAAWVQQQMQAALADYLGRPPEWHHCAVHRWRYALPQPRRAAPAESCWWDAAQSLGVCGDFLGGTGVEGAWLSAQALVAAVLDSTSASADASAAVASHDSPNVAGRHFTRRLAA